MKPLALVLISSAILFFRTAAQDKLPAFGMPDKAELELKDCSFDPGAEAVVLFEEGDFKHEYLMNVGWNTTQNFRVRIKVLKDKGTHLAEVKLHYYFVNGYESISNIGGIAYNLDQNGNIEITKLQKSAIYEKSVSKVISEISFAIPNVRVGTVFEFRYKRTMLGIAGIPPWTFQREIPVKYSAYHVVVAQYVEYNLLTIKRQEMTKIEGESPEDGVWYIMHNVPGLKDEPHSYAREHYMQRIEFEISRINAPGYTKEFRTTWKKIIDELLEDENFQEIYRKKFAAPDELTEALKKATSLKETIGTIYAYVQKNMEWDQDESIYAGKDMKEIWDKKRGNTAEINFILLRWLRDAGVKAYPLLVSSKENGPISLTYPFLRQFNALMVYALDGTDKYVLNAADKENAIDLIPVNVLYTNALLVASAEEGGGIVELNNDRKYIENIFFSCNVGNDGNLSGQAKLTDKDYARGIRQKMIREDKLRLMLEENEGVTIKVDSVDVPYQQDRSRPLEQDFSFTGKLENSGEYYFMPFNLFTGLKKNPFIQEDRVMEIDLDYPQTIMIAGTYRLPENLAVTELPGNTRMIMPDTSIILTRIAQQDGNAVSFRITLEIVASGYSVEGYPYLKQFYTKMYEMLNERIVLKKK